MVLADSTDYIAGFELSEPVSRVIDTLPFANALLKLLLWLV